MPHHIALLAGACENGGQVEEAVTLLDDALQVVERTGERWFAAELRIGTKAAYCYSEAMPRPPSNSIAKP
jgi:hypothetical protein